MSSAANVRVLVADDHALVRHGTREILEGPSDIEVVGEAADGAEAVALVEALSPDVVLLDVAMPVMSGPEVTKAIVATRPATRVLALSVHDDDEYVFEMLEAGAAGYLLKDVRDRELIDAVRSVAAGEVVLHPAVAERVLRRVRSVAAPHAIATGPMTEREHEVLRLVGAGHSNREIADLLGVSARTVEVHLGHAFRKLGVRTRTQAVIQAVRQGLIEVAGP